MFDGHVTDFRLTAAVDGNTVGDHTSIDDAACQAIVAAVGADVVEGNFPTKADDGFRILPIGSGLQNGVVGKPQINAQRRLGGRRDGVAEEINTVREIDSAFRIVVDQFLQHVGDIRLAVRRNCIRDNDITGLCRRDRRGVLSFCNNCDEQQGETDSNGVFHVFSLCFGWKRNTKEMTLN